MEYLRGERFSLLQPGEFSGFAVTFNTIVETWMPTRFHRGAFEETLKARQRPIKLTWMHNLEDLIGVPLELTERPKGLWMHGKLSMTRKVQYDYLPLLKDGVVDALSIGWNALTWDIEDDTKVDGGQVRDVWKAELIEVALVGLGADPKARIEDVAALRSRPAPVRGSADALAAILHMEALVRQYGQSRPHYTIEAMERIVAGYGPRPAHDTPPARTRQSIVVGQVQTDRQRAARAVYAIEEALREDERRRVAHARQMGRMAWDRLQREKGY